MPEQKNNLSRYRIKNTVFKSGRTEFRAQKKIFIFWADIDYCGGADLNNDCAVDSRNKAKERIVLHKQGNTIKDIEGFEKFK